MRSLYTLRTPRERNPLLLRRGGPAQFDVLGHSPANGLVNGRLPPALGALDLAQADEAVAATAAADEFAQVTF